MIDLEHKYARIGAAQETGEGLVLTGHASLFGAADRSGDIVAPGAYAASLKALAARGGQVRMLWQHDPAQPIGVWDEVREDGRGLFVRGRLLAEVARAREAAALIAAGAMDGLSIGYRTKRAHRDEVGRRVLTEIELWEVSLVTFPKLPDAVVAAKGDDPDAALLHELAEAIGGARLMLAGDG